LLRRLLPRLAHNAGKRALRAAFVGFFVDMFDMYLTIVVLGPAMSYFQPEDLSPAVKSTLLLAARAFIQTMGWSIRADAVRLQPDGH
jgi:hypothetical protein